MTGTAKDQNLAFLKIAVVVLNENGSEVDYKLGRPFCMEDFDNMSSELMLKVVVTLLKDMIGNKPITKLTPLSDFNKFGVGDVSYDCGIDHIYHAVKKIFPEQDELFEYFVLLLPTKDVKRTKNVITYIMMFFCVCDYVYEKFDTCFKDIIRENDEKVHICNEIEDIKTAIAAIIQEKETANNRLPMLEKEIRKIEDKIQKEQVRHGKLNERVVKLRSGYEAKETEVKQLLKQLEDMEMERSNLETQIVANPEEIQAEHATKRKQLESLTKVREVIGAELNVYTKKSDEYESLIDRANVTLQNFDNVIAQMENAKSRILTFQRSGNATTAQVKKVDQVGGELEELIQQFQEKNDELNTIKTMCASKRQAIVAQNEKLKLEIKELRDIIKQQKDLKSEISSKVTAVQQEIGTLKLEIKEYFKLLHEELPQYRIDLEESARTMVAFMANAYGTFPPPPT